MGTDGPTVLKDSAADAVGRCCVALESAAVVIVPTETVYGLAVLPRFQEALSRLREIKNRPREQRFPIAVSRTEHLEAMGAVIPPEAGNHIRKYWPGPLTLALALDPAKRPAWVENGAAEAAFRSPDSEFLLAVIDRVGPVWLTSANRHGQPAPNSVAELDPEVVDQVDLVIDGGVAGGQPSTLVNYNLAAPKVEREGPIELLLGPAE